MGLAPALMGADVTFKLKEIGGGLLKSIKVHTRIVT